MPGINVREKNFKTVADGKWHICTVLEEDDEASSLSIVTTPSDLIGRRPAYDHLRLFGNFVVVDVSQTDTLRQGTLLLGGHEVPAIMDGAELDDSPGGFSWFVKVVDVAEAETGSEI